MSHDHTNFEMAAAWKAAKLVRVQDELSRIYAVQAGKSKAEINFMTEPLGPGTWVHALIADFVCPLPHVDFTFIFSPYADGGASLHHRPAPPHQTPTQNPTSQAATASAPAFPELRPSALASWY